MISYIVRKIFGSINEREINKILADVNKINALESSIMNLSDEDLVGKTHEFKERIKNGESLDSILHEAFAVVREGSKRVLGMRHFDVQLIGGIVLHQGKISEMRTGEGKTLVSTLPSYLNALTGRGVHIVTPNDYLSKRDSEWMGKIHRFLGLSVGCVSNELTDIERKDAYACDITYATNNELGFDFLRDNMKYEVDDMVQRERFYAIVDEVDSILIDEARTPLIISGPTNDNSKLYEIINIVVKNIDEKYYNLDEKDRNVSLTEEGIEAIEKRLLDKNIIKENESIYDANNVSIVHHVNQALKAHKLFKNEIDYIVKNNQVIIIDEFTGRMQEGRRFSDGLHQALEAKEGVSIRNENQTLASITFQNYFRLYDKLAGMTGTAATEAIEFEEIYGLKVIEIPTNRVIKRSDEQDEIYKTSDAKYNAILNTIEDCYKRKQPTLVGTVSIEKSEYISNLLKKRKIPHHVLNAKYHEMEADIIAEAGIPGAVTIATNMAGRGTDIMLGGNFEVELKKLSKEKEISAEEIDNLKKKIEENKKIAIDAGGLYVIGTERHESRRIDNQLRGRSGRQGDPGNSKFFISLDDELMRIFGSDKLQTMLSRLGLKDDEAITHPWITKTIEKAQNKVEYRNYEIRKNLLKFDDIINEQRKYIFKIRNDVIKRNDIKDKVDKFRIDFNNDLMVQYIPKKSFREQWDIEGLKKELVRVYGFDQELLEKFNDENLEVEDIQNLVDVNTKEIFDNKRKEHGEDVICEIEKQLFIYTLDNEWKDHLLSLDKLRSGINLRAYAQKDPFIEYKTEAHNLFEDMMLRIEDITLNRVSIFKVNDTNEIRILEKDKVKKTETHENLSSFEIKSENKSISEEEKIGRNSVCPCGSGKKFKHCHGKF